MQETPISNHDPFFILFACLVVLLLGPAPGLAREKVVIIEQNRYFTCPTPMQLEKEMRAAVNAARAGARTCGGKQYQAAAPVAWHDDLAQAAERHAGDMAEHDSLSHTGSDGSSVEDRITAAGYPWRAIGENIAGGKEEARQVVAGWLKSPGHCANIMHSAFAEMGAACARNPEATYGTYWALVLAAPR